MLRRLLSLDYLLEHPQAAWLPTEGEKVNALAGAGIARHVLPRRLYQGAVGVQYRCSRSPKSVFTFAEIPTYFVDQPVDRFLQARHLSLDLLD